MIKIYDMDDKNFVRVICDDLGEYINLSNEFTSILPYNKLKYMPAYKDGSWDGIIRYYNRNNKTLYRGFLKELIKYCEFYNKKYEIDESLIREIKNDNDLKRDLVEYLSKDLYPTLIDGWKIRKYQAKAFISSIENFRKFLVCPTSSGKTFIMYMILRFYIDNILEDDEKILIIIPSVSLIKQTFKELSSFEKKDIISNRLHVIYSGQDKKSDKQIYISTYQSVYDMPIKYFKDFKCIIVDEAHQATAESIKKIINKCKNAIYRVGMTGSLNDLDFDKKLLISFFGEIEDIISLKQLNELGFISDSKIFIINLKYNRFTKEVLETKKQKDYMKEVEFISNHVERNKKIVNIMMKKTGNKLFLFNRKTHGKLIKSILEKEYKDTIVYFIDGSTKLEKREEIRMQMEQEDNAVLVASWQCIATGFSIKKLYYVAFFSTYKSSIKNLQAIGRVLRLHPDKKKAYIVDFVDDMRLDKKIKGSKIKNLLYRHSLQRQKIYFSKSLKYVQKTIEI